MTTTLAVMLLIETEPLLRGRQTFAVVFACAELWLTQ